MYLSDIEIEQEAKKLPITDIAKKLNIKEEDLIPYGHNKAKVNLKAQEGRKKEGNLILVTATTPTPAGEGKTTTAVGLADSLNKLGYNASLSLREPSLGPVFGVKGGATGGGYAQVTPMEDINLHFTGDLHAVSSAHNLLVALLDNHIYQGNELDIDPKTITLKRVIDMNDRQLRNIVSGLGGSTSGYPREDGFELTVASEIMAILCLASDLADLKKRLGKIVVARNYSGELVTAEDLNAVGSMATLLKEAIKPNLVQTLEHTPTFIHGGPFANIAHGCSSVIATKMSLACSDYTVTEAGFASDLGAEKFFDIKCRTNNLSPKAVVLVTTIRSLKMQAGIKKAELVNNEPTYVEKGLKNLKRHINNITKVYKLPLVVALNEFPTDTKEEKAVIKDFCDKLDIPFSVSSVWKDGSKGGLDLAEKVVELTKQDNDFTYAYDLEDTIEEKLNKLTTKVYGGKGVELSPKARKQIKELQGSPYKNLPLCIAKTPYSFSDNKNLLNAPTDFTIKVRELKLNAGAGFIVVYCGSVMTMPGLPKEPAANNIDISDDGKVIGLF